MLWWTLRQLKSRDSHTRLLAAEKLGESKNARAVEPLTEALKDVEGSVAKAAAEAMGKIGPAAVEPLVSALKHGHPRVREPAAQALGKIGSAAVGPLAAALKGPDQSLRRIAARALADTCDPRAAKPLAEALKDEHEDVRRAAAKALHSLGWRPTDDGEGAFLAVIEEQWEQAVAFGTVAVEPLMQALHSASQKARVRAAAALGQLGDRRAADRLVAAAKDVDASVAEAAFKALVKIDPARAEGLLLPMLKEQGVNLPRFAFDALDRAMPAWRMSEEAQAAVLSCSQRLTDPNGDIVLEALQYLGDYCNERTISPLLSAHEERRIPNREEVFLPLERILARTIDRLSDEDLNRIAALKDVIWQADVSFIDHYREMATQKRTFSASGATVRRLAGLELACRAAKIAEASLDDPSAEVREAALERLGGLVGSPDADCPEVLRRVELERLRELERPFDSIVKMLADQQPIVRIAAVKALGRRGDARAIEPLRRMLEDDHGGVRQQAARVLKKMDPRWRTYGASMQSQTQKPF